MQTASINCITRLRIHADGQGVRSVIFFQGCPLDCSWCCNPETRHGTDYRTLTPEQLFRFIRTDVPYFRASDGGVTFSGGEPLLWSPFLAEFLSCYCQGFRADIETSLQASQEAVTALIPYIDLWNVDFKLFDPERHRRHTGCSNRQILQNLRLLASRVPRERILITYPIIPTVNDDPENIQSMIAFLRELGLNRVELHPYRQFSEDKHRSLGLPCTPLPRLDPEQFQRICELFRSSGFTLADRKTLYGKDKCTYLKSLRIKLVQQHGLDLEILPCSVTEDCIGTCPRCEYELAQICRATEKE